MIRVGVVGSGGVAEHHMSAYMSHPATQVVALASLDEPRRRELSSRFAIERQIDNYQGIMDDKNIDLVDICLPHNLHHAVVLEAIAAGKHVILEKPIALTLEHADEMIAAAERGGHRFFVALNQRFVPPHRKAKELIDCGSLGTPFLGIGVIIGDEYERMNQRDNWKGTWERAGGGALVDTGTHIVDLMHWYFGKPTAVMARAERLVVDADNKADDNACGVIEFEGGALSTIVVSYTATGSPWTEQKEIVGTKGSLRFSTASPVYLHSAKGPTPLIIDVNETEDWWGESVQAVTRHFVDCLVKDEDPEVTPQDARWALKTVLALYESAQTGQRIELT